MAAKYPPEAEKFIYPSPAIDVIWHAHIINSKMYLYINNNITTYNAK